METTLGYLIAISLAIRAAVQSMLHFGRRSDWSGQIIDALAIVAFLVWTLSRGLDLMELWLACWSLTPFFLIRFFAARVDNDIEARKEREDNLLETAFTTTILVSLEKQGRAAILRSSATLDTWMGNVMVGKRLVELFVASNEQFDQFLGGTSTGKVVRRLLTTVVSECQTWRQDVELRTIIAATDEGTGALLLGLNVMGERLPVCGDPRASCPSTLLERSVNQINAPQVWSLAEDLLEVPAESGLPKWRRRVSPQDPNEDTQCSLTYSVCSFEALTTATEEPFSTTPRTHDVGTQTTKVIQERSSRHNALPRMPISIGSSDESRESRAESCSVDSEQAEFEEKMSRWRERRASRSQRRVGGKCSAEKHQSSNSKASDSSGTSGGSLSLDSLAKSGKKFTTRSTLSGPCPITGQLVAAASADPRSSLDEMIERRSWT
jgi:hypothetical protein